MPAPAPGPGRSWHRRHPEYRRQHHHRRHLRLRQSLPPPPPPTSSSWTGDLILTGSTLTVNPISVGAGGTFVIATYTGSRTDALGEGSLPAGYNVIYDDTAKEVKLVVPAAGYTKWAADNAPGQAIDLDHDFDGVDNGIEYFMGQSGSGFTATPMLNASNVITWTMGATYTGVYGTDYVIQTSDDLNTWASAPVGEVTIVPGTSVSYTLTVPASASSASRSTSKHLQTEPHTPGSGPTRRNRVFCVLREQPRHGVRCQAPHHANVQRSMFNVRRSPSPSPIWGRKISPITNLDRTPPVVMFLEKF